MSVGDSEGAGGRFAQFFDYYGNNLNMLKMTFELYRGYPLELLQKILSFHQASGTQPSLPLRQVLREKQIENDY